MDGFAEFLSACFSLINLPYTAVLLVLFVYWLSVILGALDIDTFDFDLDADVHADVDLGLDADIHADVHADIDGDVHGDVGVGGLMGLLQFFGFGHVPLMILFSIMVIAMWAVSVLGNYYFNTLGSLLIAALFFIPNLVIGLFAVKLAAMPLGRIFRAMADETVEYEDLCGTVAIVITSEVTETFGQVELQRKTGAPLRLNAISRDGEVLKNGDYALILRHDMDSSVYTVEKTDSPV